MSVARHAHGMRSSDRWERCDVCDERHPIAGDVRAFLGARGVTLSGIAYAWCSRCIDPIDGTRGMYHVTSSIGARSRRTDAIPNASYQGRERTAVRHVARTQSVARPVYVARVGEQRGTYSTLGNADTFRVFERRRLARNDESRKRAHTCPRERHARTNDATRLIGWDTVPRQRDARFTREGFDARMQARTRAEYVALLNARAC